ncbi:MAG: glycosyltransferase family 39 protein [Nanoarchaeota archaeon]|nr:glycosyltransferase family 39 protein [Nanoarchaeota archaeon]
MKGKIKDVVGETFWYLLIAYTLFVILIALGFLGRYALQFHMLAVVVALFGIVIIGKVNEGNNGREKRGMNKWLYYGLFALGIIVIIALRVVPYIRNSIPLGYDAGIYKYGIEGGLKNMDNWILSGGMEPGFLYLMEIFKLVFSVDTILVWVFIAFCVLLGIVIYVFTRELGGKRAGLIALIIYAVSVVQFKVFGFMYYKNIVALCIMLFSLFFLLRYEKSEKKSDLSIFVVLGGLVGAIHRPTFYIFGLSYFVYAFIRPYEKGNYDYRKLLINVLSGVVILVIALSFYVGSFMPAITSVLPGVAQAFVSPGESPGTFISFFEYQFSVLAYLPFALLGLFHFLKKKDFNIVVLWVLISGAIVYFQFFFFNRFIIHLDVALIVLAGIGFDSLIKNKRKLGILVLSLLLISAVIISSYEAQTSKPLISKYSLDMIKEIRGNIEVNASVLVISREYSPWVMGYSGLHGENVIAPGLFDTNKWNEADWQKFWNLSGKEETKKMLSVYDKPLYLFGGTKSFKNECFEVFLESKGNKLYKYTC